MPFEVNNFAIRTWNVVLASECLFVSENVVFDSEICILVRSLLGIYSFTFGTPINSGILRSGSAKCRFCIRNPCQKAVVFRDLCGASSRILYCEHSTQYSHLLNLYYKMSISYHAKSFSNRPHIFLNLSKNVI